MTQFINDWDLYNESHQFSEDDANADYIESFDVEEYLRATKGGWKRPIILTTIQQQKQQKQQKQNC